jgi:dolichol-phosphate mannosyltransferase
MIWILLPAYNEEQSLPLLLPKIVAAMRDQQENYHIVVVNDGSTDRTSELLHMFTQRLPLSVITHKINRGLGETERDGFEYIADHCAPDDLIVRMDCDDTHEPQYIADLKQMIASGYDVVNTSRFQPGGGQKGVNHYRAFISIAANLFMRLIFRIQGTRDYSCGFRAYRAQVIQDAITIFGNYFFQLRGMGFTSTLEMIVKLHLLGCRFAEVPFILRYDQKEGTSKMVSSITTLGYFIMALLYHWPFGGWKQQYQGLSSLYRGDREQAIDRFGLTIRRRTVSRISM